MKKRLPVFAREYTAAALLDMRPSEFRRLVREGALPPPIVFGKGVERWDVEQLHSVLSGSLPDWRELEW